MNILVIGENLEYWQPLLRWIEEFGWDAVLRPSCREGMKELERNLEIDVILLDTVVAEDTGLKLLQDLARDRRLHWLPAIVVGKDIDSEMVFRYSDSGVSNIVILPTRKDTFQAKLLKASEDGRPTVLVVDDEEFIRDLLGDILALERYRVLMAGSAEDALEILKERRVDAVITDIMMPGKSGVELMSEAKQMDPDLPVILITGHAGQCTPKSAIGSGADGFFAKPFKNVELSYTLRGVLERAHSRSPRTNHKESSDSNRR
jgi:DNA-binding NtrC family response regulator